jgi:iron complex outermembrane receptor protein
MLTDPFNPLIISLKFMKSVLLCSKRSNFTSSLFQHFYFLLIILSFSTFTVRADDGATGSIKGKVTTADGQPAIGITIALKNTTYGSLTDADGRYVIAKIKPGSYTIRVSAVGLAPEEKSVTVASGSTQILDFMLNENASVLKEVAITGAKSRYKADVPSNSMRLNEPLLEAPQNIQVITAQTLSDQQVISMGDGVIRNVSGATRLEHWGDLYTRVNMRGSRAAAFRNGMNVTSNWGPLSEDMSFVDRIEFVKGPAGFMMSNGEPSGIYNVVTKKPTGRDFNGEATMTMGSYDLYRATLDLDGKATKSGSLSYRLNLMDQTKNSFRNYEFNDRFSIAPVLTWKVDDKTSLTFEYTYQHAKLSNLGSYYVFATQGYAVKPRDFTITEPGIAPTYVKDNSAFIYLNHQIDEHWKLTGQLGYFNYQQQGSSGWVNSVKANGDLIRSISIWDASNVMKFGQVFLNGDVQTGAVRHRILGGLDLGNKQYVADWGQGGAIDSEAKPFNINNPVYNQPALGLPVFDRSKPLAQRGAGNLSSQSYTGVYGQDELGFFDNVLRVTIAGRYTYVKEINYLAGRNQKKFTPRFGVSVNIDRQTSVYGLFDQSFVPQSALIRDGSLPKPITGNNLEAGIKRDWFDGSWSTTLSAYRILKNNTLTADPDNKGSEGFVIDVGQTKTQGIEFDTRGQIFSGLSLVANYAYTDSKISKTGGAANLPATAVVGAKVPGYAKHNINASLTYTIQSGSLKNSGIYAGATYQGDRTTWTWNASSNQLQLPDYYKFDGGVFWGKDHIKISANVYNLLDKYLYSGAAYATYYYWQAEAGRNYRLGISYRF